MQTQNKILQLENIKCGGCGNFIENKLRKDFDLTDVNVDYEKGEVEFTAPENLDLRLVIDTLSKMGYPEIGTGNTIQKAKSYVSCMIGRMN